MTLANNGAALVFPTYIIREFDADNVETSLLAQLERQLPGVAPTDDKNLSFNFYLTVPINSAPVLEPTYLNPFLESAGNLGYTDVERVQNADGDWEYVRTFDDTEVPTAFGSFPDVEWGNVPADLLNLLRVGIEQAIDDGIEGEPSTNALAALLGLLGLDNLSTSGGSGLGLSSISDLTEGLVGNALGSTLQPQSESLWTESLETTGFAPNDVASTTTGSGQTVQLTQSASGSQTPPPAADDADDTPAPRRGPVRDVIGSFGNSVTTPKTTAATGTSTNRPTPLKDAVKQASGGVKKTVDSVSDGLKKAVNDTAKKLSDAATPKEKAPAGG